MADYPEDRFEQQEGAGPAADDVRHLWSSLRQAWTGRNSEYGRARRLYRGEHWDPEENPRPKNRYSITVNYLKPFADKDVQILMGQIPGIQVPPPDPDSGGRAFAERIENLLYGNWNYNQAHRVMLDVAFNATVLRRGLIYYWWDPAVSHVRWESCTPENFYPVYDGNEIVEVIYVTRRLTRGLKLAYPHLAAQIYSDDGMEHVYDEASTWSRVSAGVTDALGPGGESDHRAETQLGYTTVLDYYDNTGAWLRLMGDAVHRQNLNYPIPEIPFIEVVNGIQGEGREPTNSIDSLAELNMYYNQLISQRADVIKKWSNPPIIDRGTGVAAATIKSVLGGDGGVLPINPRGDLQLLTWQGSMPEISEQMAEAKEAMYDLSGKPRSAFGQTITNQSGVMTNLALTPTLQSNEMRETLWGFALMRLNDRVLRLYEKFSKGREISFKGTRQGKTAKSNVGFEVTIKGSEINGWYENRIKWPSAIRVDDPAFVQTELSKLQAKPQAQSIYDTLENLGIENVEAYIDRIRAEHEDPRIHPEIMQQAIDSLVNLSGTMMGPEMAGAGQGLMQGAPMGGAAPMPEGGGDPAAYNQGMIASGYPPAEV